MTDTTVFFGTGKLNKGQTYREIVAQASAIDSLRIQDRNQLPDKVNKTIIKNNYAFDKHHENNFFDQKK